jgi:hypothetical protein
MRISAAHVQLVQRVYEREQMLASRQRSGRVVRSRMQYHLDPSLRDHASEGDDILAAVNMCLDRFGMIRSKVQRELHQAFLNAIAGFIYGPELQLNSDRILAENGWTDFKLQTMAMTPRRFGATSAKPKRRPPSNPTTQAKQRL